MIKKQLVFRDIIKLFINQVGITIFSLILYTGIGFVEDNSLFQTLSVCISIFSCLFYFALIYNATWDLGANDKIRIDAGRITLIKSKGAILALFANLPNFILSFLAIIFMGIYLLTSADWLYSTFGVLNLFIRFLNSMFLGIIQVIFSFAQNNSNFFFFLQTIGYFVAPMVTVLVAHLGYKMGLKEFRVLGFLSNKPKKK